MLPLDPDAASPWTLEQRAEAAARAGWKAIGFQHADLKRAMDRIGFAGVRSILDRNGLALELEALFDWFADGERRRSSDAWRDFLLRAAGELGALHIKACGDLGGGYWPRERLIEEFGALTDAAIAQGTRIGLELVAESGIADMPTALAIVESVGSKAGGLVLDSWQLARCGIPMREIDTIPPEFVFHVELADAAAEQIATAIEDTVHRRRLPGAGDIDLDGFVRHVRAGGYTGFWGVEIISDEQRKLTLQDAVERPLAAAKDSMTRAFPPP